MHYTRAAELKEDFWPGIKRFTARRNCAKCLTRVVFADSVIARWLSHLDDVSKIDFMPTGLNDLPLRIMCEMYSAGRVLQIKLRFNSNSTTNADFTSHLGRLTF